VGCLAEWNTPSPPQGWMVGALSACNAILKQYIPSMWLAWTEVTTVSSSRTCWWCPFLPKMQPAQHHKFKSISGLSCAQTVVSVRSLWEI
jgi:hypothetical protein